MVGRVGIGFVVVFSVTELLVSTGLLGAGGETFSSNLWIAIPVLASALLGLLALVSGVAWLFRGERSLRVWISMLVGLLVTAFAAAEAFGPAH